MWEINRTVVAILFLAFIQPSLCLYPAQGIAGEKNGQESFYQEQIKDSPQSSRARTNYANFLIREGRLDDALTQLKKIPKENSLYNQAQRMSRVVRQFQSIRHPDQRREAMEKFFGVVHIGPEFSKIKDTEERTKAIETYLNAEMLKSQGRLDDFIGIYPLSDEIDYGVGMKAERKTLDMKELVAKAKGDSQKRKIALEQKYGLSKKTLIICSTFNTALMNDLSLAWKTQALGDPQKTERIWRDLQIKYPDSLYVRSKAIEFYAGRKDNHAAEKLLEEGNIHFPGSIELHVISDHLKILQSGWSFDKMLEFEQNLEELCQLCQIQQFSLRNPGQEKINSFKEP